MTSPGISRLIKVMCIFRSQGTGEKRFAQRYAHRRRRQAAVFLRGSGVTFILKLLKSIGMNRIIAFAAFACLSLLFSGCCVWVGVGVCPGPVRSTGETGLYSVDAGNRRVNVFEAGSSLQVGISKLRPNSLYEIRLGLNNRNVSALNDAVSFARIATDGQGNIPPFVLWYQSGVVGCSERLQRAERLAPFTYRTFEAAELNLSNKMLTVAAYLVAENIQERKQLQTEMVRETVSTGKVLGKIPESVIDLPVVNRKNPILFPCNAEGCLINSSLAESQDLYASGRHFQPGESLEISVVPNQRVWHVGDGINDLSGVNAASAPERVTADQSGNFKIKIWDKTTQGRGVYDIVAKRISGNFDLHQIDPNDIISYGAETGFVFYLRYPVGGPTMDIAGRPVSRSPYFQFADAFARNGDVVWGAVDPTYVPGNHPGGKYAAYYVVQHRDVSGWNPAAGGSTNLVDLSGAIEIMLVKAGCVNGTDIPIWYPPLALGDYDVVVEFGSNPAENRPDYSSDGTYDAGVDFLDGADQVGFTVAEDPYTPGPFPIGEADYSQDDYFPIFGNAANVDLRAVVRYPATSAGANTPVAAGAHPIFIIEHGNHRNCESSGHSHSTCPNRTPNHHGYMRLLEILASHGIIAVSIDAYDLTGGVPQWIEERGTLLLKHLELWSHMNDHNTYPSYPDFFSGLFLNHVDLNKISLCGHSRGGEASVAAYMINTAFNIGSVSSIAPVDGQGYTLPDVPYFVILPAADGDVINLSGIRIYDRAGTLTAPVPDGANKSGIYVYGANHNYFNTVWAGHSDDSWDPLRDDKIEAADQQRIGEAYLAAFARIHLNNEIVYEDMLRGRLVFPSTAGFKIYHMRHEKNHRKRENGSNSGTSAGGIAVVPESGPSVHVTQALRTTWNSNNATLTYNIPAGQSDVSAYEVLSFRAAQTTSALNPASGSQDVLVELIGGGKTKAVFSSNFDLIPKPYKHPVDYAHNAPYYQYVMTTVRIPLHSFIMNKSDVPLNNIDTVRFNFSNPSNGEIYVDDIEFSR